MGSAPQALTRLERGGLAVFGKATLKLEAVGLAALVATLVFPLISAEKAFRRRGASQKKMVRLIRA